MPPASDARVLVGASSADDAAIYRLDDDKCLVQTIDFFTPIVDDPYAFGAIAAANSLSDVYAMGGRPILALNVVAFPRESEDAPMSVLREILRGGSDKAREAGIDVVGGHTIDDPIPKYGMAVSGLVHPRSFWTNNGGKVGDQLVLTKPLGSGIITTALRRDVTDAGTVDRATEVMATLNRAAAEAAAPFGIHACTDVTGFGFLGHLREMLSPGIGARVRAGAVPQLPGTRALAERGVVPRGTVRNLEELEGIVRFDGAVDEVSQLILCDAQTSGGLLFAVPPEEVDALLSALAAPGVVCAAVVGELVADPAGALSVEA